MLFFKAVIAIIWISSTVECEQLQPTSSIEHEVLTDISYIDIAQHALTMPLDNVPLNNKPSRHHLTEGHRNNSGGQTETPLKSGKEKPHLLLLVIASCNTLLIIRSLIFNLFIVTHYWTNSSNLPSILYFRNSVADSISAIGFLLQVPLVMRVLEEDVPTSLALISYWITTVSVRMSVFMNCVLGVVRCINILNPFYPVNRKYVTISTLMYLLLWSTITSLDIWTYITKIGLQNKVYLIKSLILKAEPGFSLTSLTRSVNNTLTSFSQGEIVLLQFLAPVSFPALLCFVLMTIQIYHLTSGVGIPSNQPGYGAENQSTSQNMVSSEEHGKKKRKKPSHNRKAAVTILIVTTIYVLTSVLMVAVWLIIFRTHLGKEDKIKKLSWKELGVIYISSSTSPLLCSAVTAVTLFLRSSAMQLQLKEMYRKTISHVLNTELTIRG